MDSVLSVQNKDFTGDGKEFTKVPRAAAKKPKLFTLTIHWSLENLVKINHGIIEHHHLIDPKQMALLKEPYDEWKKELQQYCCNQDGVKDGGLILWCAGAICEMSKTSWQTGKLEWKTIWRTIQRVNNSFWSNGWRSSDFNARLNQDFINLARKSYQKSFFDMSWSRGDFGKEIFWFADLEDLENWMHQKFILEESTRKKCW